jgi:hypothetical protein
MVDNEWTQEGWERGNPEVQLKNKLYNKVVNSPCLSVVSAKYGNFIKFEYEMLKPSI